MCCASLVWWIVNRCPHQWFVIWRNYMSRILDWIYWILPCIDNSLVPWCRQYIIDLTYVMMWISWARSWVSSCISQEIDIGFLPSTCLDTFEVLFFMDSNMLPLVEWCYLGMSNLIGVVVLWTERVHLDFFLSWDQLWSLGPAGSKALYLIVLHK